MTVVVDASAAVELVRASTLGIRLADRLEGEVVIAPALLDVETLSGIRRLTLGRRISAQEGRRAIQNLREWPLRRVDHGHLLDAAFELRDRFSAYDGVYVALAISTNSSLMTIDAKLARAASNMVDIATT